MSVVGTAKERILLRESRVDYSERYFKRTFLVRSNNHKDDSIVIEKAFGLPKRGYTYVTEHTSYQDALCYNLRSKQVDLYYWEVECEYSTDPSKFGIEGDEGGGGGKDPLFEQPVYTWSVTNIREVVTGQSIFKDYTPGNPEPGGVDPSEVTLLDSTGILNSAYEPYVPPAEVDRCIPTLTFERNESSFNNKNLLLYVNSVNNRKWNGWHKRTVKIAGISATLQLKTTRGKLQRYWKVQYILHFNTHTWDLFLLDIGTYYFKGGRNANPLIKMPFMTKGVMGIGLLTSDGDESTAHVSRYNRYRVLDEINFGKLHIPLVK